MTTGTANDDRTYVVIDDNAAHLDLIDESLRRMPGAVAGPTSAATPTRPRRWPSYRRIAGRGFCVTIFSRAHRGSTGFRI